jgi:hypothetical protein
VMGALATLLLWFGIPALTSRSAFVAGTNAEGSVRALKHDRVLGTIDRFLDMHETALELAALLAMVWAALRRDRRVLTLGAITVAWVIVEIAFALHGWPGLQRYMYEAGAAMVVLAGVGIGWLVAELARRPAVLAIRVAAPALAVVIVAALIPAAASRARAERSDLNTERGRTTLIDGLGPVVAKLGGTSLLRHCGEPLTSLKYQSALAWTLHINVATVGWKFDRAIRASRPIIIYDPRGLGWRVLALRQQHAGCPSYPSYTPVS